MAKIINTITLTGNATRDAELLQSANGKEWCKFTLAVERGWWDRTNSVWREEDTMFVSIKTYESLAQNVARSVKSGMPLVVHGQLVHRFYDTEREGRPVQRCALEVAAWAVGPDLARGVASFSRVKPASVTRVENRALAEAGLPAQPSPAARPLVGAEATPPF